MINLLSLIVLIVLFIVLICVIIRTLIEYNCKSKYISTSIHQFTQSINLNSEKIKKNREDIEIKNKDIINKLTIMIGGTTDESSKHDN